MEFREPYTAFLVAKKGNGEFESLLGPKNAKEKV
jgi:hypothetical protein